jgi:hypothetical protein
MTSAWTQLWSALTLLSKSDLQALQSVLSPVGGSIVYLSPAVSVPAPTGAFEQLCIPAWVTVGFAGSFAGLASLNAQVLPFAPAQWSDEIWKTLSGLKAGAVLVAPGGAFTSSAVVFGASSLPPGTKSGPAIDSMMVLGGG